MARLVPALCAAVCGSASPGYRGPLHAEHGEGAAAVGRALQVADEVQWSGARQRRPGSLSGFCPQHPPRHAGGRRGHHGLDGRPERGSGHVATSLWGWPRAFGVPGCVAGSLVWSARRRTSRKHASVSASRKTMKAHARMEGTSLAYSSGFLRPRFPLPVLISTGRCRLHAKLFAVDCMRSCSPKIATGVPGGIAGDSARQECGRHSPRLLPELAAALSVMRAPAMRLSSPCQRFWGCYALCPFASRVCAFDPPVRFPPPHPHSVIGFVAFQLVLTQVLVEAWVGLLVSVS